MEIKKLFKTIQKVSKKTSTDVYIVGGFVRDLLLFGKKYQAKDIDFVVLGSGLEFAKEFDSAVKQSGSLVEFEDFDTARYVFVKEDKKGKIIEKLEIEFAGARSEEYKKMSRKPKVEPATLEKDLSRRDFTVNAMALPISIFSKGVPSDKVIMENLIDPYGGTKDLQKKVIKTPLNPDETFSDDPLRMLRAVRFASQLDFKIDKKTYKSIKDSFAPSAIAFSLAISISL